MNQIADGIYGDLALVLIDDVRLTHPFSIMLGYVDQLNSIYPVKCIQLATNDQPARGFTRTDILPPGVPVDHRIPFLHGIYSSGDFANIMSPHGAREILRIADSHKNLGVPNCVFWWVARDLSNFDGYYCATSIDHTYTIHEKYTCAMLTNCHGSTFENGRNSDPTIET